MANTLDLSGLDTLPQFNDQNVFTCLYDGQTFDDPEVYQQHMLMYHGINVSVQAGDGSIIQAPVSPVISQPIGIIAPGVTLIPINNTPATYTPVYTPPLQPVNVPYTPAPSGTWQGQQATTMKTTTTPGKGSDLWAWAGIVAGILAFSGIKSRTRKKRRTTRAKKAR